MEVLKREVARGVHKGNIGVPLWVGGWHHDL
jgi:hypothetical protein